MDRWFEELDFDKNPFDTNPLNGHSEFVGHSGIKDEIIYRIISGNMLVIEGSPETGKTTLLKFAIDNFKGKGKVIYVDCKRMDPDFNITNLVFGNISLLDKLRGSKPKNMILLLDEIQFLSKKNSERIKHLYDHNYIRAVVFTSKSFNKVNISPSLKHRIGRRIIHLKELTEYDAIEIIRGRIGEHKILSDDMIKEIFKKSNGSPKQLLENCEKLCAYAVENGEETVLQEHINALLGGKSSKAAKQSKAPKEEILEPEEIVETSRTIEENEPVVEVLEDEDPVVEPLEEDKDTKKVNIVYEKPQIVIGPKEEGAEKDIAERYY
ncbi:orc1/cdc6 family replication initiation protein [Candidatus Woesearchaeota archaeon]|nr:orc1/cdc6 family replication initiation protein [Candidatus Woesearchaeota archaeon]